MTLGDYIIKQLYIDVCVFVLWKPTSKNRKNPHDLNRIELNATLQAVSIKC